MIYLFCGSSPLSYGRGGGDIDIIFIRSPGCGSQRLLRPLVRASHPAGRGPNSSSLFPPLAAVVAVASGLTDGSRAVSTKKEDPLSELQLREGVFFLASQMTSLITTFIVFIICTFSQKVKLCTESLQKLPHGGFPFLSVLRFFPDAEQPPEQASQALGAFENDHLHRADHLSSLDTPL